MKIHSLLKLSFNCLFLGLLTSCQTLPFKKNPNYLSLEFSVKSSFQNKETGFSAYASIKKAEALRIDIMRPFIGSIAHLFINNEKMVLQFPSRKEYYKGTFNSQIFLPQFNPIPSQWIFSILKNEIPIQWNCTKSLLPRCQAGDQNKIQVTWLKRTGRIHEIELKDSKKRYLILRIKRMSYKPLGDKVFEPQLKNYKQLKEQGLKRKLQMF